MRKLLCCAMLFAWSQVSLADEPPVPMPPETPSTSSPERVPALPTFTPTPAGTAARVVTPAAVPVQAAPLYVAPFDPGVYYRPEAVVPPANDGLHLRYPYYSYRRPWYPPGPASVNVTIIW